MAKRKTKPPLGTGERFARCVAEVERRGTARDPKAVCAAAGRRKYGGKKMAQLAAAGRRRKRRNPDDDEAAAAKLSEKFHGRKPKKVTDLVTEDVERYALAELGRLQELHVILDSGRVVKLEFTTRRPRVAAAPDGGQLYLEGGDQKLDLGALGLANQLPKDHLEIGRAWKIVYRTSKRFHDFEPTDYVHEFGEDGGQLPTVGYDVLNQRLYLIGGSYQVKPEGIVN